MRNTILPSLLVLAASAAAEAQEVQYPEPQPPRLTNLVWRLPAKYATLEGGRLVVDIPPDAYPADAMATAELPAALLEGAEGFAMSVSAKGGGLAKPTKSYLGLNEVEGLCWGFIRGGMGSVAKLFVAQMQDYLELGADSRMNTPGILGGNWQWRMLPGQATPELAKRIAKMTRLYGRSSI